MRTLQYDIEVIGRGDKVTIIPLGDIHYGAKSCDEKKLREIVKYIRDTRNVYWIGMGDYIDGISINDKRFDAKTLRDKAIVSGCISQQVRELSEILKPIAGKCIGLLEGNHEETICKRGEIDPVYDICRNLGVANLTYTGWIRLFFRRKGIIGSETVIIYASHGAGGGVTWGGNINKIMKLGQDIDADIYLMGHVHKKVSIDAERLVMTYPKNKAEDPRVLAKKRIFVLTGTFLETFGEGYSTYSERKMYSPTPTGVIKITIEPFRLLNFNDENKKRRSLSTYAHIHASV